MAYLLDDDTDELLDQQKKQQQPPPQQPQAPPPQAIGTPISQGSAQSGAGTSVGPPVQAQPHPATPTAQPPTVPEQNPATAPPPPSIGTPISNPAAPRPAGNRLEEGLKPGGKLAPPDYAGKPWLKALDILGSGTKIGQAIETGAGIGTMGHAANLNRAEGAVGAENREIASGEAERQANATLETKPALTQAQTGLTEAKTGAITQGQESVEVTLPDGTKQSIPRSALGKVVGNEVNQQGQDARQAKRLAAAQPLLDAREKLAQAQTELAKFHADPNNPQAHRAQQMMELAQQRYALAQKEFEYNYDPSGLSPQESAMLPHDEAGGAIPLKSPQAPTAQTRSRGQMAAVTMSDDPALNAQIDKVAAKIGPGEGRWNQLWVNKAGMDDPDFAKLDGMLGAKASGLVITHFGARGGGQQYIAQIKKDLGEAQSVGDLKARLSAWDDKMAHYAAAAGVHTGGGQAPAGAAPAATNPNDPLGIR